MVGAQRIAQQSATGTPCGSAPGMPRRDDARCGLRAVGGSLLSLVMVAIVSAFVLATTRGLHAGFLADWLHSGASTWPVAFIAVTLVAPWVRRIVAAVTAAG